MYYYYSSGVSPNYVSVADPINEGRLQVHWLSRPAVGVPPAPAGSRPRRSWENRVSVPAPSGAADGGPAASGAPPCPHRRAHPGWRLTALPLPPPPTRPWPPARARRTCSSFFLVPHAHAIAVKKRHSSGRDRHSSVESPNTLPTRWVGNCPPLAVPTVSLQVTAPPISPSQLSSRTTFQGGSIFLDTALVLCPPHPLSIPQAGRLPLWRHPAPQIRSRGGTGGGASQGPARKPTERYLLPNS